MLPDTSRVRAQISAGSDDVNEWRRFVGWGEDRYLAHSAVAVQLQDKRDRERWDKVPPKRRREQVGSLMSFAPTRRE